MKRFGFEKLHERRAVLKNRAVFQYFERCFAQMGRKFFPIIAVALPTMFLPGRVDILSAFLDDELRGGRVY